MVSNTNNMNLSIFCDVCRVGGNPLSGDILSEEGFAALLEISIDKSKEIKYGPKTATKLLTIPCQLKHVGGN